ncbi:3'-5' exoribonuclease HELZ2-like isoform X2 [Dysidea avara]|uniref:3'-5' exoribonuclease HELZ2-like isoform X2 n=1 Tax=Dysidea avara TaxID=196820 RepID=UPI003332E493
MPELKTVCWQCYQLYNQYESIESLLKDGCLHLDLPHHQDADLVKVRCHESGLLLRPFPRNRAMRIRGNFQQCHSDFCLGPKCTYAHNGLELHEWNKEKQAMLNRQQPDPSSFQPFVPVRSFSESYSYKAGGLTKLKHKQNYELPPESKLNAHLLTMPLTRENYVDKFHTLLYYEEHEHKRVLEKRCNKQLEVSLFKRRDRHDEELQLYGCMKGLNSDDVAYLQQAAEDVTITVGSTTMHAEILKYDVSKKGLDVVNIKFDNEKDFDLLKSKIKMKSQNFPVCFVLKHSYFRNLHKSLDSMNWKIIERLIPHGLNTKQEKLPRTPMPVSDCLLLDKEYQLLTLKKMMACDSSVPFLVTGPFGTGKTRLLATAAVNFLKKWSNRILICTSHLQSADAYIDTCFGPLMDKHCIPHGVIPIRLIGTDRYNYNGAYPNLLIKSSNHQRIHEIKRCRLVITTFLTAPQLIKLGVRPFSHILIDEGAQTREPEAIAPLGLADDNTKIVIAGDHLQIGPQMLVLGDKARANELGTSLLQRLHELYGSILGVRKENPYAGLLLTNYRCHDSILRLPSNLFFKSTLQVRTNSRLHPKTVSALEFVCTSVNSTITISSQDYSEIEARATLEQIQRYVDPWPTTQWGKKNLSTICAMASSRNQARCMRKMLNQQDFKNIKDIQTLATFELQGREFRAIFISTLEKTEDDGSTSNPTKSICDQYAFNTVITRAQSLVVCVGNPFLLFSIEKSTGYIIYCWREYVKRCLETSSLKLTPQCYEAGGSAVQESIHKLYIEVFGDIQDVLASPCSKVHEVSDSILEAYKRAFQSNKACQNVKVILGNLDNGDRGYVLERSDSVAVDKAPEDAALEPTLIECYLENVTFRKSLAIPLDPKKPPITIQGINNRRCALEGAQVIVRVYKNSDRCGRVCEVVEQGPQRQFVCRVDNYNAIFFSPIDRKSPKLVNLPGLSREMLEQASKDLIIKEELKYKRRAVTIFDPKSFNIPSKPDEKIEIPQIKDVIPLSIAQKLLFVVWYLRWRPKYRYPLGVVIAAIPKGLTLYHGERLLLAHNHVNTDHIDKVPFNDEIATVATTGSSLPHYDHAFTIDPPEAMVLDDALTLEPVASDDGKCYQLGVHITNVGGTVKKGSEVDVGAQKRSTAVYVSSLSPLKSICEEFSPSVYPILPEKVRSSLSLDCDRKASAISYTCQVRIDGNNIQIVPGTVKICESYVQSRARLTYEEVQHSLAEVKDISLDEKVAHFHKALSTNKTFGLEQRLALLLQISESFFRNRVKSDDMDYSTEDANQLSSPQAYFLVKELMVWANKIAAEHILTAFPELALLRRQKPPNQEQLVRVLKNYKDIVVHSPVHKTLADNLKVTTEPGPVVIMDVLGRHLYEALQHGNLMQAKNVLRITNYYPQLAVLFKEVNSTRCRAEYICTSILQQQKTLSLNNGYLVSLPQDENEVYGHNDLCCLYTHSTSPLRRYIDIVVQRLILQSLSSSTAAEYTSDEIKEICVDCNTKSWNARKVGKECDCLSIALSLAKCSQSCTVYISKVEKSLYFVIQELDYHCLSLDQRSFHLSSITSNARPWVAKPIMGSPKEDNDAKGSKVYMWKAKITSFSGKLAVDGLFINAEKCQPSFELTKDTMITFYIAEAASDSVAASKPTESQTAALTQRCYMAEFPSRSMSLVTKDWKTVTNFKKLPSPDLAAPLKDLLGSHQCISGDGSIFPGSASFFLYEAKRSFKIYESFEVSFTASYSDHILSPCIQLLEVAPMLNVCVQHSTKPADCFSSPILSHASKVKYNDIHEYIELWESVLLAEAAVQSVGEAEIQLIQNVPLKWPNLRQPGSSLDDVYYSPIKEDTAKEELADITLTIPAKFEERCGEYFDLQVGNLVCARYNIPLGEEKEVDGRKVTTASAVYHFIIHQIEDEQDGGESQTMVFTKRRSKKQNAKKLVEGSRKVIHLKFASKDTARVSPFMRQYLKDSTCEIQVIPLDLPYRRMYRSLLALRYTENHLCKEIAVGNGIRRRKTSYADQRLIQIRQNRLVYELWSDKQRKRLNGEQARSVETAMRNTFQLIQGPPGTGKSVTGSHLAYAFIQFNFPTNPRSEPDEKIRCVMYCGPSNKSVDVVLDMFLKHPNVKDLRILRIYSKSIETKSYYGPHSNKVLNKPSSEQECSKAHEPYALHKKIRSRECPLSGELLAMEDRFERYAKENKLPSPLERMKFNMTISDAEKMVIRDGNYQIVFCTCNEASSVRVVDNIKPTHLIIDEAAMATEPEAMIPIQLADHVTLIGDHQQLQPVINYNPAKEKGLGCSLFERYAVFLESSRYSLMMLTIQYRMHEAICEFPSEEFYDGRLITHPSVSRRFCSLEGFWPNDNKNCPIAFCDVEGKEEDGSSHHKVHQESKSNRTEAEKIAEIIVALKQKARKSIIKDPGIAVLTPYKAQKKLLEDIVKERKLNVTVCTINESQGSEFDFVIFSTVRSMPKRSIENKAAVQADRTWIREHLGFITDHHQICVGITRAKHGLVIVGNSLLLDYDGTWRRLLSHYYYKRCVVKASSFPRRC